MIRATLVMGAGVAFNLRTYNSTYENDSKRLIYVGFIFGEPWIHYQTKIYLYYDSVAFCPLLFKVFRLVISLAKLCFL